MSISYGFYCKPCDSGSDTDRDRDMFLALWAERYALERLFIGGSRFIFVMCVGSGSSGTVPWLAEHANHDVVLRAYGTNGEEALPRDPHTVG